MMPENNDICEWLDNEIMSSVPAIKYAEENIESIISSAYSNCVRKVYTTHAYELEKDIPNNGGIYFELHEPTEDGFGVYFCISESFDPEDDDWACDIKYCSGQMFNVNTNGELEWEDVVETSVKLIKKYLKSGEHKDIRRRYEGIGAGFPDGDIEYIT